MLKFKLCVKTVTQTRETVPELLCHAYILHCCVCVRVYDLFKSHIALSDMNSSKSHCSINSSFILPGLYIFCTSELP